MQNTSNNCHQYFITFVNEIKIFCFSWWCTVLEIFVEVDFGSSLPWQHRVYKTAQPIWPQGAFLPGNENGPERFQEVHQHPPGPTLLPRHDHDPQLPRLQRKRGHRGGARWESFPSGHVHVEGNPRRDWNPTGTDSNQTRSTCFLFSLWFMSTSYSNTNFTVSRR